MGDLNITQESIYNKLRDLNISKSPGPDMLHPRVLYRPLRARTHQLQFSRNGENRKTNFSWSLKNRPSCRLRRQNARDVKNSFPNTTDKLMLHRENRFSV